MPGARMRRKVTTKFAEPTVVEIAEEDHPQRIEIDVRARIVFAQRIRNVVEPAVVGRGRREQARIDEEPRREIDPVGECVEAGKRHVPRAQNQGKQIVAEAREHWRGVEEDHRDAVHREQLVILLGRQQRLVGTRELDAQDERLETAGDEKDEGGDDVAEADLLVVDGRDPAEKSWLRRPNPLERPRDRRLVVRADDLRDAIVFGGGHASSLT